MIEFNEADIKNLIFHRISNQNEKCYVSINEYAFSSIEEVEVFKKIFLKPFVNHATTYEFKHEIALELNPLFKLSKAIFEKGDFIIRSHDIHQHLKSVSKHPNIKDGDLFIVNYDNIQLNDVAYKALGIYKIENKESFIETITSETGATGLQFRQGIGTRKPDKACLILFTDEPYTILTIDNGSTEADYWQNEFIKINLKNDDINSTNQFLTLTKTFLTEQLPSDFNVSKADQIDLLNRSVDYFKTHESFNKGEFEQEVFHHENIISSFRNFDDAYSQQNELDKTDGFLISPQAVKKQARVFKTVLKLDRNFHIYIHGDRELIEQGVDEKGRKFYKLYFKEES